MSKLYVEGAGLWLLPVSDDIVESRLLHDERGLVSSSSTAGIWLGARDRIPFLFAELPRDCVARLPSVESRSRSAGRLRRKREDDSERVAAEVGVETGTLGPETARRGGGSMVGEEMKATSLPGDFRLPGLVRMVSSPAPRARPATARPMVPKAHNYVVKSVWLL